MNDEMIEAMESDYARGFNDGYIITERLPELAKQLSHPSLESPWFEGFRDGRTQYVREQAKEMRPAWLDGDRNAPDHAEPGQGRDAAHGRDRQDDTGGTETARPDSPQDRDQDHER